MSAGRRVMRYHVRERAGDARKVLLLVLAAVLLATAIGLLLSRS